MAQEGVAQSISFLHRSSMRGRPPRRHDPALAARVREFMAVESLSMRALAKKLDVDASTLSRALQVESFSPVLDTRLTAELTGLSLKGPAMMLQQALLKLQQLDKLRDEAEAAVRLALDHLRAGQ